MRDVRISTIGGAFSFSVPVKNTGKKTVTLKVQSLQLNGGIGKEIHSTFPVRLPPEVSIAELVSSGPFVTAKLLGTQKQEFGQIAQVGVIVKSNAPSGSFTSHVTIFFKGGDIAKLSVPVNGYINDDVFFTPAMILMEKGKAVVTSSYQVALQSPVHQRFAITDWETSEPTIEVQAQRNVLSDMQHIVVQVQSLQNATALNGRITFTLSDGRQINLDVE